MSVISASWDDKDDAGHASPHTYSCSKYIEGLRLDEAWVVLWLAEKERIAKEVPIFQGMVAKLIADSPIYTKSKLPQQGRSERTEYSKDNITLR